MAQIASRTRLSKLLERNDRDASDVLPKVTKILSDAAAANPALLAVCVGATSGDAIETPPGAGRERFYFGWSRPMGERHVATVGAALVTDGGRRFVAHALIDLEPLRGIVQSRDVIGRTWLARRRGESIELMFPTSAGKHRLLPSACTC